MVFDYRDYGIFVMHCPTYDDTVAFVSYLVDNGVITPDRKRFYIEAYRTFKEDTCIRVSGKNDTGWDYINYYIQEGYNILCASDYQFNDCLEELDTNKNDSPSLDAFLNTFVVEVI